MIENIDDIIDVINGVKEICRFTDCSQSIFKREIRSNAVSSFKGLCMFHNIPSAWDIDDIKQKLKKGENDANTN